MILRKYFINLIDKSTKHNNKNILDLLEKNANAKLLDLGCNDGKWTIRLGKKIGTNKLYGIDIVDQQIKKAIQNGIRCQKSDLNSILPFENNFFDVVHANQVIEHIYSLETFISEIYRVLKWGGVCNCFNRKFIKLA